MEIGATQTPKAHDETLIALIYHRWLRLWSHIALAAVSRGGILLKRLPSDQVEVMEQVDSKLRLDPGTVDIPLLAQHPQGEQDWGRL